MPPKVCCNAKDWLVDVKLCCKVQNGLLVSMKSSAHQREHTNGHVQDDGADCSSITAGIVKHDLARANRSIQPGGASLARFGLCHQQRCKLLCSLKRGSQTPRGYTGSCLRLSKAQRVVYQTGHDPGAFYFELEASVEVPGEDGRRGPCISSMFHVSGEAQL